MLGKYDSLHDSAIHFLCSSEWSNDSTGDVSTFGKFVFRIELSRNDVFGCFDQGNMEFDSLMEEWEEQEEIKLSPELKESLIGFWLVIENESGQVQVIDCGTELGLKSVFNVIEEQYAEFAPDEEIHQQLNTEYNRDNTGE